MRSRTPYRISPWLSSKRTKSVTSTYAPSSARNRGSGCGCIAVSLCLCGLATACVSANRASTLPKKAGRQFVSIALSQRSAKSKKRHMFRGSLPTWEEGQWFPLWVHWTGHFFGCAKARGGGRCSRIPSSAIRYWICPCEGHCCAGSPLLAACRGGRPSTRVHGWRHLPIPRAGRG